MKNNTRSITDFSQLIESLNESGIKNNVAVVWAEDNHTLDAVEMACKAGVITPILVCSQQTADKLKGKYRPFLPTTRRTLQKKQWNLCGKEKPMP